MPVQKGDRALTAEPGKEKNFDSEPKEFYIQSSFLTRLELTLSPRTDHLQTPPHNPSTDNRLIVRLESPSSFFVLIAVVCPPLHFGPKTSPHDALRC